MTFRSIREWLGRFRSEERGLRSPGGMAVLAAYPDPEARRTFWDADIRLLEGDRERLFRKCGHRSRAVGMSVYGNERRIDPAKLADPMEGRCPECMLDWLRPRAIRCALCGHGIVPNDGVALYDPGGPDIRLKEATLVNGGAVGCLRWDCCPSGGTFAGHWTDRGFRSAFADGATAAESLVRAREARAG